MATYYISSAGTQQAPYDTPAKGFTSLNALDAAIVLSNNDIIRYATDVNEPTGNIFRYTNSKYRSNITIDGNGSKRIVKFSTSFPGDSAIVVGVNWIFRDLIFYFNGIANPSNVLFIINTGYGVDIQKCEFINNNVTGSFTCISYNAHISYPLTNFIFKNNIIVSNSNSTAGISLAWYNSNAIIKIINNTFYNSETAIRVGNNIGGYTGGVSAVDVKNNIIYADSKTNGIVFNFAAGGTWDVNYNDVYGYTTPYTGVTMSANSISADPLFTSASVYDFSLQYGIPTQLNANKYLNFVNNQTTLSSNGVVSPCISAGVGNSIDSDVPTTDYNGTARSTTKPCMGAIETTSSVISNYYNFKDGTTVTSGTSVNHTYMTRGIRTPTVTVTYTG